MTNSGLATNKIEIEENHQMMLSSAQSTTILQEVDGNIGLDRKRLISELYEKKLLIKSFDGWIKNLKKDQKAKVKKFHKRQKINFEN